MADDALFSRAEVLGGLPARRAATLLYLIESRTARLAEQRRHEFERYRSEETARQRELAFFEAFAQGRAPSRPVTIQEIERWSAVWADLVPDNPRVRAALAHALEQKYVFPVRAVPGIRRAVGLDETAVRSAFVSLYRQPLDSIFAVDQDARNHLRWLWAGISARLESLSPFWTVFALTLTEMVGAGLLALPIAVAGIGPLPGVALLVIFGLVNIVTVASVAECVTRTGSVRYQGAYFGRIVSEYLGRAGSILLSSALAAICVVALLGYYIGASTSLEHALWVPAPVWMLALFLIGAFVITRDSLTSTVASALGVGAVNLFLVAILSILALTRFDSANLRKATVPGFDGQPWDPSLLSLIFGVVLVAYFGHMSAGNCGRVVLRRDPSGRSLLWGTVAAQAVGMVAYCGWVVAINGAIPSSQLQGQESTALVPLADEIGPTILIFGSLFVVLGMGMGSIHMSFGLFNIVRDWLPRRARPTVRLERQGGRLVIRPRRAEADDPSIVVTYSGLVDGVPTLRVVAQGPDGTARRTVPLTGPWDARDLIAAQPSLQHRRCALAITRVDESEDAARVTVETPWSVAVEGQSEATGLTFVAALDLGDDETKLIRWLTRHGEATAAEIANGTGLSRDATAAILRRQVDRGALQATTASLPRYQVKIARRRGSALPDRVWQALGEETSATADRSGERAVGSDGLWSRLAYAVGGERARLVLGLAPVAVIFLTAVWMQIADQDSFTAVLNFGGLISVPIFAGVFSCLLLAASRRRGDVVPAVVIGVLGHPIVLALIYGLFVAGIFLHGLIIWSDPLQRAGALIVGTLVVGTTIAILRRGALERRVVVTVRQDGARGDETTYAVVAGGKPVATNVRLRYPDHEEAATAASGAIPAPERLASATFQVASGLGRDLRVWTPRQTASGQDESLPALACLRTGEESVEADLRLGGGQALLPLNGHDAELDIRLVKAE